MIDNILAIARIIPPTEVVNKTKETFYWKGILFKPVYGKGNEEFIKKYIGDYKELRFELENENLSVSNSLHKFYKGNNYTDFSFTEIKAAISELCNFLQMEAKDF